jgi:hypothetical protein
MVTYGDVSSLSFFDNLSLTNGIFRGFIKHETILRAGFPKGQIMYTFPIKKLHFQSL